MEASSVLKHRRRSNLCLKLLRNFKPVLVLSLDQAPVGWDLEALVDDQLLPEPPLILKFEEDIPL